jgi:hypothetical protein
MRPQHALLCAALALLVGGAPAAEPAPPPRAVPSWTVRVLSTDKGTIAHLTLTGDGFAKPLELKADTDALTKKLKELAAAHKGTRMTLTYEIDGKLLQASVVLLIDLSVSAGFEDVKPVPIDPKDR